MLDIFDPRPLGGGPACVEHLRALDIRIGQRLGSRLHALGRRGICFSLALLEGAGAGSDFEAFLLGPKWAEARSLDDVQELLAARTDAGCASEGGLVKVVGAEELDEGLNDGPGPGSQADEGPDEGSSSLLPALLGTSPRIITGPAGAGLWDRSRLEQAALAFMDSEDLTELIEQLRYLFRAALLSGLDPVSLLVSALRRRKPALSQEAASLVRQHLHRDLGRALEDLLGGDEGRLRDGLHYVIERQEAITPRSLTLLVLPAVTSVLGNAKALRILLGLLPAAVPLVAQAAGHEDLVEEFLDRILVELQDLEAPERLRLSRFLLAAHESYPHLDDLLFRRLVARADPHEQAFFGNVLSRMRLDGDLRRRTAAHLVEALLRHPNDVGLQERLKVTFLNLGPMPLALLMEPEQRGRMTANQRTWVLELWAAYLAGGHEHPPLAGMAALLLGEVAARHRGALVSALRTGLIHHPAVAAHLAEQEWIRQAVFHVLLEEILNLEDPDDRTLVTFLASLGLDALQAAFDRAREETALDSRSAPYRFRCFALVCAEARVDPAHQATLLAMIEESLGFPFAHRAALPVVVEAWGALGRVTFLPEALMHDLLERIMPPLLAEEPPPSLPPPETVDPAEQEMAGEDTPSEETEPTSEENAPTQAGEEVVPVFMVAPPSAFRFAGLRVQAALSLHGNPASVGRVRERIEERFEHVLAEEQPPRELLVAVLDGVEALLRRDEIPVRLERMAVLLARVVLKKSRETSLDRVMRDMLRDEAEGQGVRMPEAWDKEDRDRALVILGKVAAHAGTPDPLHRMMTSRLVGFLEDWLDAQESGANLYLHRDTPLWTVLLDLVRARRSEHSVEAVVRVGLRAIEAQRKAPQNMALDLREDVQRLVAELIWLAPPQPVEVRGSLRLDIPRTAFQTLLHLATRENPTALRVLDEISGRDDLPPRFKSQLEGFLAFHRRPGGGE